MIQAHVVTALFPLGALVIAVAKFRRLVPFVGPRTVGPQGRALLFRFPLYRELVPGRLLDLRLADAEPEPRKEVRVPAVLRRGAVRATVVSMTAHPAPVLAGLHVSLRQDDGQQQEAQPAPAHIDVALAESGAIGVQRSSTDSTNFVVTIENREKGDTRNFSC